MYDSSMSHSNTVLYNVMLYHINCTKAVAMATSRAYRGVYKHVPQTQTTLQTRGDHPQVHVCVEQTVETLH